MTSTTDTTQHPDVTEISDLAEDILPVARATEIRHHLLTCPLCEDVLSSLEEIRSLLGSLPEPSPLPADIADRIDAALAAEMLLDSRPPAEASSTNTDVSRETASQAAEQPTAHTVEHIAGQLSGTAAGTPRKPGAPMSRSTTRPSNNSTGPGRRRFPRRRRIILGTAFGAAILGMGALVFQTADLTAGASSDKAGSGAMAASAPQDGAGASSAVEFTAATLADQVRGLLDSASALQRAGGAEGSTPQEAGPSGIPTVGRPLQAPSVPACVQRALGRTASVIAVETGIYRGTDTYLVVLPHPTDGSLVTAYLVDAGCTASDPSDTGILLFTHAYPRT